MSYTQFIAYTSDMLNKAKDLIIVKETIGKGKGVFAIRHIKKDEVITQFDGPYIKIDNYDGIAPDTIDHFFNIGVNEYVLPREPGVRTNHSCSPNAGILNTVFLVAMRDIQKDEEVTFDYSMIIADNWTLHCLCGSPNCRKLVGPYKDLPQEIKNNYAPYTPEWIKRLE